MGIPSRCSRNGGWAEEETRRVREWQELFGKYKASSFPLPPDRVYHLQCDTPDIPEKNLDLQSSGLADKDSSVALVINQFCNMGLSHQAVAQASPEDNRQAESHQVYDLLRTKHREAVKSSSDTPQLKGTLGKTHEGIQNG